MAVVNYLWHILNEYTTIYISILLTVSIWVVSIFAALDNIAMNHNSHTLLVGM